MMLYVVYHKFWIVDHVCITANTLWYKSSCVESVPMTADIQFRTYDEQIKRREPPIHHYDEVCCMLYVVYRKFWIVDHVCIRAIFYSRTHQYQWVWCTLSTSRVHSETTTNIPQPTNNNKQAAHKKTQTPWPPQAAGFQRLQLHRWVRSPYVAQSTSISATWRCNIFKGN